MKRRRDIPLIDLTALRQPRETWATRLMSLLGYGPVIVIIAVVFWAMLDGLWS